MHSLYIFLDESGNFDFSPSGTKHFVLCGVTALSPLVSSSKLQELKYRLLAEGTDVECFHASPDTQAVRNEVFEVLKNLTNVKYNFIYADKRKAHPKLHNPAQIYALLGKTLLKYVINGYLANQYQQIVVVFDKALTNADQQAFLKTLKPELKQLGKPYRIYFHRTMSDFNGQIADYGAWAKYVSLERNEQRPLQELSSQPIVQFDIFRNGKRFYYN